MAASSPYSSSISADPPFGCSESSASSSDKRSGVVLNLITVGDPRVGKTTLVQRLGFDGASAEKRSSDMTYISRIMSTPTGEYTLQIWDTLGLV